jgi:hydroxymethylbilane synthase
MSKPENHLIIGSRGSDLALWQANYTQNLLEKEGYTVEIKIIKTQGDKIQHLSFDKMEGKGFFTKELEEQLLNNSIDLAVHSHKDLETSQPENLCIAGVSYRESPEDVLLIHPDFYNENVAFGLNQNAIVGTSSARRKAHLLRLFPSVVTKDLRGNVPTRINKLKEGNYHAIVLARAGLERLNIDLGELKKVILPPKDFVPAPAQGVLAYQCKTENEKAKKAVALIANAEIEKQIFYEREVLRLVQGGCHVPLGVYVEKLENDNIRILGSYSESDTSPSNFICFEGKATKQLPSELLEQLREKTATN